MIYGVLIPAAILGGIVLIAVLIVQRARGAMDLSPRSLLRIYLYLASLAGIVTLAIGLSYLLNFGIARVAGDELIYGSSPSPYAAVVTPTCAPGTPPERCVGTPEFTAQQRRQQEQQRERRRNDDLLRGITFSMFGAVFWAAHWGARRGLGEAEPLALGLRRGYLMLGTVVFGLATIVLLPTGTYQALSNLLLPASDNLYRPGADALGGGIVSLPIWLVYLRLVVTELRQAA